MVLATVPISYRGTALSKGGGLLLSSCWLSLRGNVDPLLSDLPNFPVLEFSSLILCLFFFPIFKYWPQYFMTWCRPNERHLWTIFGLLAACVQALARKRPQDVVPAVWDAGKCFQCSRTYPPGVLPFKTVGPIKVVLNSLNWLGSCCPLQQILFLTCLLVTTEF